MEKLKTPSIITAEEYQRAERAGRFTITDDIFCSYCQAPVEIQDPLQIHCGSHGRLELHMASNPDFPGVPNETHGTMTFSFGIRPPSSFDTEGLMVYKLAENRGCPFCNRNLEKGENRRLILRRVQDEKTPSDLIEKKVFCPDCEIYFQIHLITHQSHHEIKRYLKLQPEAGHLDFNFNADVLLPNIPERKEVNQIEVDPEVDVEPVDVEPADTLLLSSRHAAQHTDVKGQIQAYFRNNNISVAKTEELLEVIECSRVSLNNALKRLLEDGEIRKIKQGYYEFTGQGPRR